jgi:hypothetical protein
MNLCGLHDRIIIQSSTLLTIHECIEIKSEIYTI